ncbi:MAG: hypothetical protein Q9170_006392 [Blastenia crenularia]
MPALTLPTTSSNVIDIPDNTLAEYGLDSPTSPPFSPITPVMSNTFPLQESQGFERSAPTHIPSMPPLQPFSESENPDAIALRSALSVLQIQRQQTLHDLKTLERQKKMAAADPEGFSKAVVEGKIRTQSRGVLDPRPGFSLSSLRNPDLDDEQDVKMDHEIHKTVEKEHYGDIPGPQNIVRCPPVNWAKYHVMGEPLDRLHEEQRRRPVNGQGIEDISLLGREDDVIAAPYNPWKDHLGPPVPKANHLQTNIPNNS